jgi:hypothetical protein
VPTPAGPDSSDPGAIGEALDEMERRVVGHRVGPPHSDDLGDEEDAFDAQGETGERGAGSEPTA